MLTSLAQFLAIFLAEVVSRIDWTTLLAQVQQTSASTVVQAQPNPQLNDQLEKELAAAINAGRAPAP